MKSLILIVFLIFTSLIFSQNHSNPSQRFLEGEELKLFKIKILGGDQTSILEQKINSKSYLKGEELEQFKEKILGRRLNNFSKSVNEHKFLKGEELENFKEKILNRNFNFQKLDKKEH
ncbi:hypothetical protein [Aurantibacter aestuarii]|uniref:Uncharacterized protein n=1 Tax=Aurantibacter aestuarii TaxID=1266046 RepID=A0A2T1NCN5_9FLAO|nr:hypothetical protein [Aurantibacter aestuarii]PSG90210.1 hypothetical protein C7H52_02730 [Aurantibacter aestuarii]